MKSRIPAYAMQSVFAAVLLSTGTATAIAQNVNLDGRDVLPRESTTGNHAVFLPLVSRGKVGGVPLDPVHIILDASRAVTATIGEQGGQLNATSADGTAYSFVVPAGALEFDEVITLTPAAGVEHFRLSGGLAGAVNLEPAGLYFFTRTLLYITPTVSLTGPLYLGFAFDATDHFHLRPLLSPARSVAESLMTPIAVGSELIQEIRKLQGYGVGSGTPEDVSVQRAQPRPAEPAAAMEEDFIEPLVADSYKRNFSAVMANLDRAEVDSSLAESAILDYLRMLVVFSQGGVIDSFADEIYLARQLIGRVLKHAASDAAARCVSQKRPEEAFVMRRLARLAEAALPPEMATPIAKEIRTRVGKCLTFEVAFHSEVKETKDANGTGLLVNVEAVATLRAELNTGMRAIGSAPLNYVRAEWVGSTGGCNVSVQTVGNTWDAQREAFGLLIAPVSMKSPAVNISLRYRPGETSETTVIQCSDHKVTIPSFVWYSGFLHMHKHEWSGESIRAVAPGVVGAGTFTGWVYFNEAQYDGISVVEDTRIDVKHTPQQ